MTDHEQHRLFALKQLNLLDTPASESFDRITRMASQLFGLPIAAVSLTDEDRQWFKSRVGVDHREIPRYKACCGEVADTSAALVIPDLLESDFYKDSVLAQSGIRFYAGAPLMTRDGYALGAMCVLGTEPRTATEQEMATLHDLAAMVMSQIELQHAYGRLDPLTGLPNRNQFDEDMQDLARSKPGQQGFALFTDLVDIADLGPLQRVMGPSYLDDLAREASASLGAILPPGSRVYTLGASQYVHLLDASNEADALLEASTLREHLLGLQPGHAAAVMVRPAIGVAPFTFGAQAAEDVLRISHSACQDARLSDNGVELYSHERDAGHHRRFRLLLDFKTALAATEQLHLEYQPRMDLQSGRCVGAEALIRWTHPELGSISPAEFIPLVEQTQLARPLTAWVIEASLRQIAIWKDQGQSLCISINISASNLEETDFAARLLALMAELGVPSSAIELELTEGALVSNSTVASQQLYRLIGSGIRIAIDDFGTGYSTLAYLQAIPAQVVKIDRSFITRLELDKRSQTLVKSMVSMAHDLGYSVVAEGVETQVAYDFLRDLGCDEVQGYLISRPQRPEAFQRWLTERS